MKLRKMPYWTDGERKMSDKFYAVFVDYSETLRRLPLFDDRKASDELARKIGKMNELRASGESLPAELSRYVETMPPLIRRKLAKWGILSAARVAAGKPLADHIDDWKAALLAKGNTSRHAELVVCRARKAFTACRFKVWGDISASKLQSHLATLREDRRKPDETIARGISAQTFNFYLQAVKQFCRWMVRDGRASESALAHLDGLNVKTDRRHDRRALSPDELRWLLETTADASERFGMTGSARAMLYRLAVETGLRAAELRSLTRASFNLEGDEPCITIAAAYAKNRRQDTLPLRPGTAALLADHLVGKMPGAVAFAVPPSYDTADMMRADLADARTAWLESLRDAKERTEAEKGTFLRPVDAAGRMADFHSLRHTFISGLVAGGVNPKVAQTLARHSTIGLTMDRYTHLYAGNLSAALDTLPDLSSPIRQAAVATGTHGESPAIHLSPDLSPDGVFRASAVESGGVSAGNAVDKKTAENKGNTTISGGKMSKPRIRLERMTCGLQNRCSTN